MSRNLREHARSQVAKRDARGAAAARTGLQPDELDTSVDTHAVLSHKGVQHVLELVLREVQELRGRQRRKRPPQRVVILGRGARLARDACASRSVGQSTAGVSAKEADVQGPNWSMRANSRLLPPPVQ
jgi:hypothetical protein